MPPQRHTLEAILNHRPIHTGKEEETLQSGVEYPVKWEGKDPQTGQRWSNTWEPSDNITKVSLEEYYRGLLARRPAPRPKGARVAKTPFSMPEHKATQTEDRASGPMDDAASSPGALPSPARPPKNEEPQLPATPWWQRRRLPSSRRAPAPRSEDPVLPGAPWRSQRLSPPLRAAPAPQTKQAWLTPPARRRPSSLRPQVSPKKRQATTQSSPFHIPSTPLSQSTRAQSSPVPAHPNKKKKKSLLLNGTRHPALSPAKTLSSSPGRAPSDPVTAPSVPPNHTAWQRNRPFSAGPASLAPSPCATISPRMGRDPLSSPASAAKKSQPHEWSVDGGDTLSSFSPAPARKRRRVADLLRGSR